MKKIMVIDDSAFMRKVVADVLTEDGHYEVTDEARDGIEALEKLATKRFDVLVLDINMPRMNGLKFMEALKARHMSEKIIVMSSLAADGGEISIKALELGALGVIQKPHNTMEIRDNTFKKEFIALIDEVSKVSKKDVTKALSMTAIEDIKQNKSAPAKNVIELAKDIKKKENKNGNGQKLVALCSSTGGPGALQHVVPLLPADLDAPVLIVQHMPQGFTKSLADRLDSLSDVHVVEAADGDRLQKGHVYIARGGLHMTYSSANGGCISYRDDPPREGVKPCANYMYESLINSDYDEIVCVVMTGMGQDGTEGIMHLKEKNNIFCISQEESTCTVYGMPKAIEKNGLQDVVAPLDKITSEIVKRIGTSKN